MKILGSLAIAVVLAAPVFAREVGSTPAKADAWSVHGGDPTCYAGGYVSGCEVAVDVTGNLLPTVTNTQTNGSATLAWSNLFSIYTNLTPQTTTQLALAAANAPVGSISLVQERVAGALVSNAFNLCVSTKNATASWVYLSVSTSVPAVAGAACAN